MICINRNGVIHKLKALTKQVYDVTGAGDTVYHLWLFLSEKDEFTKFYLFC